MLMPTSLKIGPLIFTVQYSHEIVVEYEKVAGSNVYGACQNRLCNIIVDVGYPLQRERKTLLHEVLHAIQATFDIDDVNLKTDSEHYIEVMSMALLDVLQQNPHLVRYLTEGQECH